MAILSPSVEEENDVAEASGLESPPPTVNSSTAIVATSPASPPDGSKPTPMVAVLGRWEFCSSLVALAFWLLILAAGLSVDAQKSINAIQDSTVEVWSLLSSLFIVATCHTVTNTALLCCVSAFLGSLGNTVAVGRPGDVVGVRRRRDVYVAAATRGFFVFLILQSGAIILSDEAFAKPTLEKYIRLATAASLLSFTTGYNPDVFQKLMALVNNHFAPAAPTPPKLDGA